MILLVGATGDLGGRVARLLRSAGQEVRCLVRDPTDDAGLLAIGAQTVRGDLLDRTSLAAACQGIDTVIATATAISRRIAGTSSASIQEVDGIGMGNLVEAAEGARVQRFVYMSFPMGGVTMGTPLEHAKRAVERRLADSPMRTVVVRADGFQEVQLSPAARFDLAAGRASVIGRGNTRRRLVAAGDVAALLAAMALETAPPAVIEVGGPEALTRNETIRIAGDMGGRRLKVRRMPRLAARWMVRLLRRRNDALASALGAALLADLQEATWDDKPLRERGIVPRPVSAFLEEQVRSLAPERR